MAARMRRYPAVKGGGRVPFTPQNPPAVTDEALQHILTGRPVAKGRSWSGGHGHGTGKGKSEFPAGWDAAKIKVAIEQVLMGPDEIERKGSTLYFRGRVFGQEVEARVRGRNGPPQLWTAYPLPPKNVG
ncbi:EndoU domain-containing protein [Mycobacterium talmoniae]|uniref:EndoU domain-containing protein n=1 Tax=Mycobacterium talmoniae TaxID=1858794 RepID=UPI0009F2B798|nr:MULTISPECIES: EndoU domain-containing protein [Mycobacterium]TDH50772.1 hypothetical protein E2F47_17305 [Mycobacterium eburneum]